MLCIASRAVQSAHREKVLLDTSEWDDAVETGREGAEDPFDGTGLKLTYDGSGSVPTLFINGPDGQIELCGLTELRAVLARLSQAVALATAFGPSLTFDQLIRKRAWLKAHPL